MKNSLRRLKNTEYLIIFFLVFSFIYLIMCPFAYTLTPDNGSQILIPQKQAIDNHYKQKDLISSPLYHSEEITIGMWLYDKAAIHLPINTHQEITSSLFIITTIRLIL